MENVYNTTDPKTLLELKRLEADALLDVLRTINHAELSIKQLCLIARNVLRAQLGVKKMVFYYTETDTWQEGMRLGFEQFSPDAIQEIQSFEEVSPPLKANHPQLSKAQVEYVIPIKDKGEVKAYFAIADFADSEVEAQNDLIFIETLGNILHVAISNKQLFYENMQKELVSRELEVAETIQKQLLISDFGRFKEFDAYGINIPHHHIGGDFYDLIKKGKGTTFMCIADVAGKGIGAALLMSNLQANLRALCAQYGDLKTIIAELNKLLYKITGGDKFVSLLLVKIDSRKKEFSYVNAGHNYPVFLKGEEVIYLDEGCTLLGIMPDIPIKKGSSKFGENDMLLTYTDGVLEQLGVDNEMFGMDRITAAIKSSRNKKMKSIIDDLHLKLQQFSGNMAITDDVTLLGIKFI